MFHDIASSIDDLKLLERPINWAIDNAFPIACTLLGYSALGPVGGAIGRWTFGFVGGAVGTLAGAGIGAAVGYYFRNNRPLQCFTVGVLRPLHLIDNQRWQQATNGGWAAYIGAGLSASCLIGAAVVGTAYTMHVRAGTFPFEVLYKEFGLHGLTLNNFCWGAYYFFRTCRQAILVAIPVALYTIVPIFRGRTAPAVH